MKVKLKGTEETENRIPNEYYVRGRTWTGKYSKETDTLPEPQRKENCRGMIVHVLKGHGI